MIRFMGALLHPYPKAIIMNKIVDFLYGSSPRLITTPNPEMLLAARHNQTLKNILATTDLGICDGCGLVWMLRAKRLYGVERITGVDVVDELARLCAAHDRSIMFIGAAPGVAAEAKNVLATKYPGLRAHSYVGPNVSYKIDHAHPYAHDDEEVLREISAFAPDVVVLALGAGIQEEWLARYKHRMPFAKILIGVGGALDMISGVLPRAPRFVRAIGLEWLWRLILQPSRIRRVFRAVVMFPFVAMREKLYFKDGSEY